MTLTDDTDKHAAAAIIGDRIMPKCGYRTPARDREYRRRYE